jgi:hypothetical protein
MLAMIPPTVADATPTIAAVHSQGTKADRQKISPKQIPAQEAASKAKPISPIILPAVGCFIIASLVQDVPPAMPDWVASEKLLADMHIALTHFIAGPPQGPKVLV